MTEPVENQTVEAIRDDLDNYGEHHRVAIEDVHGNLYTIGAISTSTYRGERYVTIEIGERVR
jgi:hypothetical protein